MAQDNPPDIFCPEVSGIENEADCKAHGGAWMSQGDEAGGYCQVRQVCYGDSKFQSEQDCQSAGGKWVADGGWLGVTYLCQFKADDAGRGCTDNMQCQSGLCIADEIFKNEDLGHGFCADWVPPQKMGCINQVKDGRVEGHCAD